MSQATSIQWSGRVSHVSMAQSDDEVIHIVCPSGRHAAPLFPLRWADRGAPFTLGAGVGIPEDDRPVGAGADEAGVAGGVHETPPRCGPTRGGADPLAGGDVEHAHLPLEPTDREAAAVRREVAGQQVDTGLSLVHHLAGVEVDQCTKRSAVRTMAVWLSGLA